MAEKENAAERELCSVFFDLKLTLSSLNFFASKAARANMKSLGRAVNNALN